MPPKPGFRETKKVPGAKKKPEKGYPSKDDAKKKGEDDDKIMEEMAAKAKITEAALKKAQAAEAKGKGNTCFSANDWAGAITHFTEAILCDPTDHVFFSNRSAAYLSSGSTSLALSDAKECVRLNASWAKGYSRLGAAFWKDENLVEAARAYDQGLKLDPSNAVLKQGREEVTKAIEASPDREAVEEALSAAPKACVPSGTEAIAKDTASSELAPGGVAPVIGIDLGTTFSCVAVWQNGAPRVLEDDEGRKTTPSCVAFVADTGERLIGERAKSQAAKNLKNTFFDVKRILGQKMHDEAVIKESKRLPFTVVEGSSKEPLLEAEIKGETRRLAPEEISAMVLGEMRRIAEARLGRNDITKAVVTVPAYFNDAQRKATMVAGQIAGLEVLRVINEPTAAALAYGLDEKAGAKSKAGSNVLIFDLGGGTFDVSALRIEDGMFEVKATGGDTRLGGEDFDAAVVDHLAAELLRLHKIDVGKDGKALARIRSAGEKAKRVLSSNNSAKVEISIDGEDYALDLTRATFESLNEAIFTRTIEVVTRVLKDAKLEPSDIDDIVLVGGSTRIPQVQDLLRKYFNNKELCRSINPDEAVAYGAAVQAAILSGVRHPSCTDLLLVDVTALSLGIELEGRQMSIILPRNTSVPCTKTRQFTTDATEAFQDFLKVKVFEGERPSTDANHLLGEFNVEGIEKARAGVPEILVTFALDANATLQVTAMDKKTKATAQCVITGACKGLGADEIKRMTEEAAAFAKEDEETRKKFELKNELDNRAFSLSEKNRDELLEWLDEKSVAERTLEEYEEKLKKFGKAM